MPVRIDMHKLSMIRAPLPQSPPTPCSAPDDKVRVPSGENPRPSSHTLNSIVSRNARTLLAALWDGKLWQDSLADAHHDSLMPCNRTRENTKVAKDARRQAKLYEKLYDRIKKAAND